MSDAKKNEQVQEENTMDWDAIVIGAGMAGISAARELSRAGHRVLVLEGRDRVGGRVHSIRDFADHAIEAGAEFIHGTSSSAWPEVVDAGLSTRPCPLMRHTMFNTGGKTRWLPLQLLHPQVWPTFDILHSLQNLAGEDQSGRQYLDKRKFKGPGARLAEMVVTAHLPGSADEVGLQGLRKDGVLKLETGLNHRLDGGYDSLVQHMAEGLDIRLGVTVKSVRWSDDEVSVQVSSGETYRARVAITTLPVGVLKSGNVEFQPPLPAEKREALEDIVMGPVVKILLEFKERFWPDWLATLASATGPITLYWPVYYGAKSHDKMHQGHADERQPVLTAYATGPRAAALSEMGEEEALKLIFADLAEHFPKVDPAQLFVQSKMIDWAKDPMSQGGYTFLRPGGVGARQKLAAPTTGALYWAGSATDDTAIAATVEAAYLSGRRASSQARIALESERRWRSPRQPSGTTLGKLAASKPVAVLRGAAEAYATLMSGGRWYKRYDWKGQEDERHTVRTADGWELTLYRYKARGKAKPHPVICGHGMAGTHLIFDLHPRYSLARHLRQDGFDTWLIDLRGRNQSLPANGHDKGHKSQWSFDDFVEQDLPAAVARVREITGAEEVFWIGMEMSGQALYAADIADKTAGIRGGVTCGSPVLTPKSAQVPGVTSAPQARFRGRVPFRAGSRLAGPTLAYSRSKQLESSFLPSNVDPIVVSRYMRNGIPDEATDLVDQFTDWVKEGVMRSRDGKLVYSDRLSDVKLPLLVLAAAKDLQRPPEAVRQAFEAFGSEDKTFYRVGLEDGFSTDFGHDDLLTGLASPEEVFPLISGWLDARS